MNKVIMIGRVGQNVEMRYTPNGQPVANIQFAVNESYTTAGGERKEHTEWFDVVVWGRRAEAANTHLTKGEKLLVEGRLHSKRWTTDSGEPRFRNQIHASNLEYLGGKAGTPAPEAEPEAVDAEAEEGL